MVETYHNFFFIFLFYILHSFTDSKLVLAYEAVSIEERADYSVQLGTIQNILWKNIATLDSSVSLKL